MSWGLIVANIMGLSTGFALVVSNATVFVVILLYVNLRQKYSVLMVMLFTSSLSGIFLIGNSLFILNLLRLGLADETAVNRHCFMNPMMTLDVYLGEMKGISLLAISVDRLLVLLFPLKYYVGRETFTKCQIIVWIVLGVSIPAVFNVLLLYSNQKNVSILCRAWEVLQAPQYSLFVVLRCLFGLLSIVVMLLVIFLLRKTLKRRYARGSLMKDVQIRAFQDKQLEFTKTMLISCAVTFVLFVIPDFASALIIFSDYKYGKIAAQLSRYLRTINCFNFVIVTIKCQNDVREELKAILTAVLRRGSIVRAHNGQR